MNDLLMWLGFGCEFVAIAWAIVLLSTVGHVIETWRYRYVPYIIVFFLFAGIILIVIGGLI